MRLPLTLALALLSTPALAQFPNPPQGPFNGLYNEQSAVVADPGGGNLVSHASRFNHLLVGEASTKCSAFSCNPKSWMDDLIPNFVTGSQIGVTSTIGTGAIGAASRTSDERTALGGPSGGSAGGYFFGVSDDTTNDGPIGLGTNSVGVVRPGVFGITLGAQQDINSASATCMPNPGALFCAGQANAVGNLITAGAFASLATQDVGAGLALSQGATQKFKVGIIIDGTAIRSAAGPSILGSNSTVGIALPVVNYIIWYLGPNPSSAVWGGSGGSLNFFVSNTLTVNGTAGVDCSGSPSGSFTVTKGLVTTC